jgi:3-oxoacyl-[acyl-carrier-protein] synthase-3
MIRSVIAGYGSYLPEKVLTNKDLEKIVDTSDEWIRQRSGIEKRHIAADDETTSAMAIKASEIALKNAGINASDIDGVIVGTTTPDLTFPSVAVKVQSALGIRPGIAFDLQAVCSGFVYALAVTDNFIRTGNGKKFLVIGAEKMSSVVDWDDRTTCVLFGDGAGAFILEADESGDGSVNDRGVLSQHLYADGNYQDILYTTGGVSSNQTTGLMVMEGKEVFRHAVSHMSGIMPEVLEKNNIKTEDIDWLVPHQANIRILESAAKKLGIPMDQVVTTVDKHGNTSAASIPLALAEYLDEGRIKKGDLLLLEALGAGLTWGAVLLRY